MPEPITITSQLAVTAGLAAGRAGRVAGTVAELVGATLGGEALASGWGWGSGMLGSALTGRRDHVVLRFLHP
jgi:hypothetical protein